ncbi:MAG: hypothetical protein K5778_01840 [Bacteroidaceae bacterium]|nr:hypothetical protein [Bacteroidaceae bacterium]
MKIKDFERAMPEQFCILEMKLHHGRVRLCVAEEGEHLYMFDEYGRCFLMDRQVYETTEVIARGERMPLLDLRFSQNCDLLSN